MPDASTSAAPADAGPTTDHGEQPSDNSVADQGITTRQDRGAGSSNTTKPKQQAKPTDDDPEWDFGDGKKAKRSEVRKRMGEISSGAQKAWKERQEYEQRLKARDERLTELGVDVDLFEKDPRAAFRKAAQEELARQLDESTRDPRELAAEKAQRERDDAQTKLKQYEEQQKQREHQQEVDQAHDQIAGHFATALKEHGLPVQPKSVWLMASLFQAARKGGERISLAELARRTEESITGEFDHYLSKTDGAALAQRLGPERLEVLRLHMLKEHQSKFNPNPTKPRGSDAPRVMASKTHPNGYITLDDILSAQRKR